MYKYFRLLEKQQVVQDAPSTIDRWRAFLFIWRLYI